MSKCMLARLVREEIENLTVLAQRLEDESESCFPCKYSCEKCFSGIITRLKRLKKMARGIYHE